MADVCLQETYAPNSICFGCGPANANGLHLRSIVKQTEENNLKVASSVATFNPNPHHAAFPSILCGGIIGTILDCHCNWTAAWQLMTNNQLTSPPCTVTAEYKIK